jgi:REP element-mobilizing transposase RayT
MLFNQGGCYPPLHEICVKYDPDRHHRRSIRLKGYDYSRHGVYFVTICVIGRQCLFGEIRDGVMALSASGEIVDREWQASAVIRREIVLDSYVIMPNHLHGLVAIVGVGADGIRPASPAGLTGPTPKSLQTMVRGFKSATTRHINDFQGTPGAAIWQRNYYERIVGNEREIDAIRTYIDNNPQQWELDKENPAFRR